MINRTSTLILVFWAIMISPPLAAAADISQRFSITVKGGINRLWNAEWSEELKAEDLALAIANLGPLLSTQDLAGTIKLAQEGFDIEFMLCLSSKFRLGGSVGYLPFRWKTGGSFSAPGWNDSESTLQTDYTFDVALIPVKATLGYRVFRSGSSALDLLAGIGCYLIEADSASLLDRSFTSSFSGARIRNISNVEISDTDGRGWGVHFGLDLEQKIAARWALIVGGNINFEPKIRVHGDKHGHERLYNDGQLTSEFDYPVENGIVPPVSQFDLSGLTFRIGLRFIL